MTDATSALQEPLLWLDPLMVWVPVAWLATMFTLAGLSKLSDRYLFVQHLGAYRTPDALLPTMTWAIPIAELLTAGLLLSPWRQWGAVCAAALLLAYATGMAWHLHQGRSLDCGCGGEALPLSWHLVARNTLLALLAVPAAASTLERDIASADRWVIAAALVLAALLSLAFHQVLRHRQHGLTSRLA